MWSSAPPVSLFSRISLCIAVLSHLLGLLGTACRRSARFARSRASLARHLGPSWARLGLPKPSQDSSKIPKIAFWKRLGRVLALSWAVLAPAWSVLALSWAVLAPSWPILAPSWDVLDASWNPKNLPRYLQDAS